MFRRKNHDIISAEVQISLKLKYFFYLIEKSLREYNIFGNITCGIFRKKNFNVTTWCTLWHCYNKLTMRKNWCLKINSYIFYWLPLRFVDSHSKCQLYGKLMTIKYTSSLHHSCLYQGIHCLTTFFSWKSKIEPFSCAPSGRWRNFVPNLSSLWGVKKSKSSDR